MIKVTLTYSCGGCDKREAVDAGSITRDFVSISGRGYGFGKYVTSGVNPEKHAPDGWVAFDPYTQITYCEDCWESIIADSTKNED